MGEVTLAHHGFNVSAFIVRRENLPQYRNAAIDGIVRDDAILPDNGNAFIAADGFVLVGEEVIQELGYLGLQTSGGFPIKQVASVGVEAPSTEYLSLRIIRLVDHLRPEMVTLGRIVLLIIHCAILNHQGPN